MKVFVTGGTGFIGTLVVEELIRAGHHVVGLARSDEAEHVLCSAGATTLRGSLEDAEVLTQGAASCDGVIHLGFSNDFSHYDEAIAMDLAAVKLLGAALEGTDKPLVGTGGTLMVANRGKTASELDTALDSMPRVASENALIAFAEKGVRSSVVRLAPCVHDTERFGLVSVLMQIAAEKGFSAYVEEGNQMWPAVQRNDAAHLFCLALESAPAGTRLHGVAEEGIILKEIAEALGNKLNIPARSISIEEAEEHFGWFAQSILLDNPCSSIFTRKLLGWNPVGATLLKDIALARL